MGDIADPDLALGSLVGSYPVQMMDRPCLVDHRADTFLLVVGAFVGRPRDRRGHTGSDYIGGTSGLEVGGDSLPDCLA